MRYLNLGGAIYRATEQQYRDILKEWSIDGGADVVVHGAVFVGVIEPLSTMSPEDAHDRLELLVEEQRLARRRHA